jgi:hypothetical protein
VIRREGVEISTDALEENRKRFSMGLTAVD